MSLLDFLFPRACLGCGETGQYFCPECRLKIRPVEFQVCPVCEKTSVGGQTHPRCKTKFALDGLISIFVYEGLIKKAIRELKFRSVTDLKNELLELIWKELEAGKDSRFFVLNHFLKEKPFCLPVPLFWYKENCRGFNQSEIIARELAGKLDLVLRNDLLTRSKFTQSQYGLNQKQRKENLQKAFSVSPLVHNSLFKVLLVDDIWTTGATLKTCGSLLKREGAKSVWGFTLAR